jgi:hypothetical protein
MKKDRITTLCHALTVKERATLAFSQLTSPNPNELEIQRITATLPVKTYRCTDLEYRRWIDCFFGIASVWSIEYWQEYSRMMAALAQLAGCFIRHGENEAGATERATWLKIYEQSQARLLALDGVLQSMSDAHGFDASSVRRFSGAENHKPINAGLLPDVEYQAKVQADFDQIVEAWR